MDAINKARPAGAKGLYIKHIVVNATMGPGIKIDPNLALAAPKSPNSSPISEPAWLVVQCPKPVSPV